MPLLVEGDVIGVLHVGTLTPRIFTSEDAELLQLAADRAAMAISHAHLYERERTTLRTLQALQRVTEVGLSYLPLDQLLKELLERMTEILHADTAAFLLLDEDGDELVATAAKGIEEEVEQGVRIPVGRGFAGRIAAQRQRGPDRGRRPRRHPQSDPARARDPVAAGRAAAGRRRR